jgi:preprotein translocase subunit SecD
MINIGLTSMGVATLVLLLLTGCGGSSAGEFRLRIYDPLGNVKGQVTESDVLRRTARASQEPDGSWSVTFRLTDEGEKEFHRLTRGLAKRGVRLHRPQRFRIEMNGRVESRSTIDYRIFPDGFGVEKGMWFPGLRPANAQRLAEQIQNG